MLNRIRKKKKILLLLGGMLIMTIITGCSNYRNKPTNEEIIDKFSDFISMFPSEDLLSLYDKEGDSANLDDGDLGTWVLSSYLDTSNEKNNKTIGVVLGFNRNTRQTKGNLIVDETKNGVSTNNKYPIYHDKDGIHFVHENIESTLLEELSKFRMMYDFISLDRKYLDNLQSTRIFYNGEVPLYGATYKLSYEDNNIQKIKEIYPDLSIDKDNLTLGLEGNGTPWNTTSSLSLKIFLDDNTDNYFTSSMHFSRSDSFNNLIKED